LEYARSRHGTNGEDSDFARSKRQEIIISAFKSKVEGLNLLSDSGKLNSLVNILADHAHTNLDPSDILRLESMVKSSDAKITSKSLEVDDATVCQGIDPTLGYVIKPCDGITNQTIQNFFIKAFNANNDIRTEAPEVIIENAGIDDAKFMNIKSELEAAGLTTYIVKYKGLPISKNVLYQVTNKPATISYLEKKFGITVQPKPDQMTAKADLVLIIGADSN